MSVSGASDGSGSGLAKYLFFVDNNSNNATQVNADSTGKKTYSYTTTTGYHTCHVSAVDKAGNVSSTKSFAEGRTKLYAYNVYRYSYQKENGQGGIYDSGTTFAMDREPFFFTSYSFDSSATEGCAFRMYNPKIWGSLSIGDIIYGDYCCLAPGVFIGPSSVDGSTLERYANGIMRYSVTSRCYTSMGCYAMGYRSEYYCCVNFTKYNEFLRKELFSNYLGTSGISYGGNCFVNYSGLE